MANTNAGTSALDNTCPVREGNCQACKRPDSVDDMVECEQCKYWYHFSCVGVTQSVERRHWVCNNCLPVSVSSRSSRSSVRKALEQQRLLEEQQIRRKRFEQEKALEKKRLEQEQKQILEEEKMERTFVQEKFDLLETQEADEGRSVRSNRSRCQNSHEKVRQWMKDDGSKGPKASTPNDAAGKAPNPETLLQGESSNETPSAINPSRIPPQSDALSNPMNFRPPVSKLPSDNKNIPSSELPSCIPPTEHTVNPTLLVNALSDDISIDIPPLPFEYAPSEGVVDNAPQPRYDVQVSTPINFLGQNSLPTGHLTQPMVHENRAPVQVPPPRHTQSAGPPIYPVTSRANEMTYVDSGPSSMQIAARRVMSRDLPDFNGNPEDWPVFISQYNITTECCNFSNAENLIRLQRCLKGHARESVRSRLLLPASVPRVIETLRMLYGRPGLLIDALLNRVRSTPAPKMDHLETLIEFGLELQGLCDHLQAASETAHLNNPSLLQELEDKLPSQLKLQWAMHKQTVPNVTLQTFATYMSHMVSAASQVTKYVGCSNLRRPIRNKEKSKEKGQLYTHSANDEEQFETSDGANSETTVRNCLICCKPGHRVKECKQFSDMSVENRWRSVHSFKLCRTCLNQHGRNRCRFSTKCGIDGCEFKHHPLLHTKVENTQKPTTTAENHSHREQKSKMLFRIIPVTLQGKNGCVNTYAFLDDGSSLTLVEKSIAEQLGESGPSGALYLNWTSNVTRCEADSQEITFKISGAAGGKFFRVQSARTVSELKLPVQSLKPQQLSLQYPHLIGLPIAGYDDAIPRVLIGLDQLNLSMPLKCREGRKGEPIATKTRLGWCIYGGSGEAKSVGVSCHIVQVSPEKLLQEMVKRYFEQEDAGIKSVINLASAEDTRAKKILADTTVRLGDKFETGLLWRYDQFEFPESYHMALRRLECLERRMNREPLLKENIHQQIQDYQAKGYAHRVSEEELSGVDPRRIWHLPLGVVTNPKKPGKIRLIWDAAAKVDGVSLNTVLLKGPDLLSSLPGVLFKFREKPVAVSGDIREMFHQILIRCEDRYALCFLWREDPSQNPETFVMDVAIFGASCSPCIAQFVKNANAEEFAVQYPKASEAIVRNHYVDDFLDSFDTVEEAQRVAAEVKLIHAKGGFEIRGWCSNSADVLSHLGETFVQKTKDLNLDKSDGAERVLGMLWLASEDVLGFSTQMRADIAAIINEGRRPTKRQVLRCVMSLFDPLGLLAIYTVHGKILIQSIWRSGIDWDEKIKDEEFNRWTKWIAILSQVDHVHIPRCYVGQESSTSLVSVQLHILVDASEDAYCAAAYFRFILVDGTVICNLVSAKTKVAPLKPLSIPRLELQAAVLGARLASFVSENHTYCIEKRVFWSDSSTVLAWIRSDARRYRQFVSCRIGEILSLTETREWRWVPSKINTADEATKWGHGPCLSPKGNWFQDPSFLYCPEFQWPVQSKQQNTSTEEELRSCFMHDVTAFESTVKFDRFSRWVRLLRAIAYTQRFISNARLTKQHRDLTPLNSVEIGKAESILWRLCQEESYPDEISQLKNGRSEVDKSSAIYKLSPYIDEYGILRQNGRIGAASNVEFNVKFPIILPKSHRLTALLLDHYHRILHHANYETVVNEVRQKFYIPNLRAVVRRARRSCQWCKIYKSQPSTPKMAPLPAARLASFERPFSYVGVDFFGPVMVKIGRSNVKRWVALFTCLTIRAVHLEVAFNLNTQSCIMCFRRFVDRRGAPLEVYTDNGTNFQGAERVLRQQVNSGLAETFTNANTRWFFNPPSAPHMGGVWERMVRSIKTAINSIDTGKKLDDEGFSTLLAEAESIVNSRPLTYLPLETEAQEALTPNHFLLGSSNGIKQPTASPINQREAILNSWNQIRHQLDLFWHRWLKEYLPTISRRTKWFTDTRPVEIGQLVLIADEGKRNSWLRGRVIEIRTAPDGRVRQATVQTTTGLLKTSF
ncbi:uncharacterized protein LOC129773008 [Toxorhynchites rutilus septentrionalis]|uniref:uncharacterized protein LOC129773008 n=1 Tax=Toxorhynchites rutilus septentrionalis TaxID=329112 RepID=UPI00247B1A4C|nr:uncharacterized protein LOC129773008 [Toxorhynchites rutilus septentrionalis]